MKWFNMPIKLWTICFGSILIMLLNGCTPPTQQINEPIVPQQLMTPPDSMATYHKVKANETLYTIAQYYGRDYQDVASWNNISPPYEVVQGQLLRIDGPSVLPSLPEGGIPVVQPSISNPTLLPNNDLNPTGDTHIVQPQETLYAISRQYEVHFRDLAAWNKIEPPYILSVGQVLVVSVNNGVSPSTPKMVNPKVIPSYTEPQADKNYHVVLRGDTLYSISRHYGYSVSEITSWNNLSSNSLSLGQTLRVSPPNGMSVNTPSVVVPSVTNPMPSSGTNQHIVVKGDTLYNISKRYNCTVSDLRQWNNLTSTDTLSLGQTLQVAPSNGVNNVNIPASTGNYHTVVAGDTVYSIARHYQLSPKDIIKWNRIAEPYALSIGQQVQLFPNGTSQMRQNSYLQQASLGSDHHIVQSHETLSSISRKYQVSTVDLADWNGIGSPFSVYPGQKILVIPPR